jgi:hypothetical protein
MNWKYWISLVFFFGCAYTWHSLTHEGHALWGGVAMGLGFCSAEIALNNSSNRR